MKTLKQVWSCGGGRQSCAIAVLIIQGRIEKPDVAVIADTGRERFTTFPYLRKYVIPELESVGLTLHVIKTEEWSYYGTRWVDGTGGLMIPAYDESEGFKRKLNPDCSGNWKRDSINRWLSKTFGITRGKYCKWIGFSCSPKELVRAANMAKSKKEGGNRSRFPLIELGLNTQECLKIVKQHGWPEPKVSACYMCPNLKDSERLSLSPEEQELAIKFDEEMRAQFPETYIHKTFQPLAQVDLKAQGELFSEPCNSGVCFV